MVLPSEILLAAASAEADLGSSSASASVSVALRFLLTVALVVGTATAVPPLRKVPKFLCCSMTFFLTGGQNFLRVPSVKPESLANSG